MTLVSGRKSRREDALGEARLGRLGIAGNEAQRARLLANAVEIQPGAVVGDLDGDFVALLPHGDA